jgi:hypothetical protein
VLNPRVAAQSSEQLRDVLRRGNLGAGMPAFPDVAADDLTTVVRYLRSINVETIFPPQPAASMTFALDGQQYVVVAAGPNILCFGL